MTREEAIERLKTDIYKYADFTENPNENEFWMAFDLAIKALEQEPKTGHCKACKWWKDSDGVYRRGVGAESKCPINRNKVYEGNGYCYMFEPQESEVENGNDV